MTSFKIEINRLVLFSGSLYTRQGDFMMKNTRKLFSVVLLVIASGFAQLHATTVTVNVDGTITNMFGSIPGISMGSSFDATFTYDTNSANAVLSEYDPSVGQMDIFFGLPYVSSATVGGNYYSSDITATMISDNIYFGLDEIDETIPAGTYDAFGISAFANDFNWDTGTGMAWTLVFVGNTNLFSGTSLSAFADPLSMLDNPDLIIAAFSIGEMSNGIEMSDLWGEISSSSPVPVPAAVWLFGSGLIGLIGVAKRSKCM